MLTMFDMCCRALKNLELKVDTSWLEQIHLTASPTRATKLFLSGSTSIPATRCTVSSKEASVEKKSISSHAVESEGDMIAAVHTTEGENQTSMHEQQKGFAYRAKKVHSAVVKYVTCVKMFGVFFSFIHFFTPIP